MYQIRRNHLRRTDKKGPFIKMKEEDAEKIHPQIASFHFCPGCGRPDGLTVLYRKAIHCSHCGFLLFFNSGAAAGILLRDAEGRILLTRRALPPGKGKLGAPGGFTDMYESSEETAVRELQEETSLVLRPESLEYLCTCPNDYEYGNVHYLSHDVYFTAQIRDFSQARPLDESDGLTALHPNEIQDSDIAFPSLRNALIIYRKKFLQ